VFCHQIIFLFRFSFWILFKKLHLNENLSLKLLLVAALQVLGCIVNALKNCVVMTKQSSDVIRKTWLVPTHRFLCCDKWKLDYSLQAIFFGVCLLIERLEFLIRGLEVLGLGLNLTLSKCDFLSFWTSIFGKLDLYCSIPWKMVFALVSDRFHSASNLEVPRSRSNPRVQIFPPEYLGSYAL
jgi:hypothetical protein